MRGWHPPGDHKRATGKCGECHDIHSKPNRKRVAKEGRGAEKQGKDNFAFKDSAFERLRQLATISDVRSVELCFLHFFSGGKRINNLAIALSTR